MLNESETTRCDPDAGDRRDAGSALIMAVLVSVVVFVLGAMWMSIASHESSASNNDRRRQHAIDAAMSGLVVANSELTGDHEYAGTGADTDTGNDDVVVFNGGSAEFKVTVEPVSGAPLRRLVTSTGYAPSKTDSARTVRRVQQEIDLEAVGGFTYGIFTEGDFDTGSGSTVFGNVYSRGNITLGNKQDHIGDMYTLGNITIGAQQDITGSLYANGSITMKNSSTVHGSAYAGDDIDTSGTITNGAQAGGTTCRNGGGSCVSESPPPAVIAQTWPSYAPSYPSIDAATFFSQVRNRESSGIFYVEGNVIFDKDDHIVLTDDMTIVSNGAIALPGSITKSTTSQSVQLTVIATESGNITAPIHLTIPATVRTLIYTQGRFESDNHVAFTGALYAGDVTRATKVSVTYAPVDASGFDWSAASARSFTIRNIYTREIANTP